MTSQVEELLASGYKQWDMDEPFELLVGPFYMKENEDGTYRSAFVAEKKHTNAMGVVHGGLLMSFADYSLFSIARGHDIPRSVTIGFNSEFVSGGILGDVIESTGEVVRATRSLVFVRGTLFSGDRTILSFSGILKRAYEAK
ncbi:MAG: PaaI family thioesterase [Kordiimonadaceae bacterium]|nr:PaaI family thioesterase [Kordiimonadaceae bacterium]